MSQIDVLFDAIESKSKVMYSPDEDHLRLQYLVGVYQSKVREIYHELEIVREILKERELELLAKDK